MLVYVTRLKIFFVCAERQPDRISELNFGHLEIESVLTDNLLISGNISVGELIDKLVFLKPHGTFRMINDIC